MKKFFVTNLIFLITLNVIVKSVWILGIDRGVQNVLSAQDYGLYYSLLNFTFLFNIFLDLGITNFNNRIIAQNPVLLQKYFAKITPLKFLLSLFYAILLFIGAFVTSYDSSAMFLLKWLCILQILLSFLTYLRSNISALLLFKTDSIFSVLDKFLTIIICSVFLLHPTLKQQFTIQQFIYIQVFSIGISTLIAFFICLKKTNFIRFQLDYKFFITIIKSGLPYALLALLMTFYNRIDTVLLERILKDGGIASAIYAQGFRLVDSVNMIAYLFSVILLPLFAKLIKTDLNYNNLHDIIKISFNLLFIASFCFAVCSFLYSTDLMQLLYNKHINEASQAYKILAFCFIPVSLSYIFGTLLTANGNLKQLNIIASIGMITNILINLLVIPKFKQLGSAYSVLTAQTLTCILQIILAIKIFNIQISIKSTLKIILYLVVTLLFAILIQRLHIFWTYQITLTLIIFLIFAFILRIFNIIDIKNYINDFINTKKL